MTSSFSNSMSTNDRHTVIGLFRDRDDAESAVRALRDAGFSDASIGMARRDEDGNTESTNALERMSGTEATGEKGEDASAGAATGAVSGGIVGGLIGLLGSLLIPGVGPIVVAGVLASALTGAAAGVAGGGVIGALVGLGASEDEANHFDAGFRSGGTIVTVRADGRYSEAREILRTYGADLGPSQTMAQTGALGDQLLDTNATRLDADHGTTLGAYQAASLAEQPVGSRERDLDRDLDRGRDPSRRDLTESERIQLREEQLRIGKEQVQAGEVRVRKEIITEQQTIQVPVTREELVIERHAVTNQQSAAPITGRDEDIRIPLMQEQVHVDKETVVREELEIGKRRVQEVQRVSDSVRREEARIDEDYERDNSMAGGSRFDGTERRRWRDPAYAGPERRQLTAL